MTEKKMRNAGCGGTLEGLEEEMTDACNLETPDAQVLTLTLREGEGH